MYYSLFHSYSIKIAPTLKNNSVPKNERLNTSQVSNEAKQCTPLIYNEFFFLYIFCELRSSKRTDSHPTVELFRNKNTPAPICKCKKKTILSGEFT